MPSYPLTMNLLMHCRVLTMRQLRTTSVLGLDVGTQSLRAALVDLQGRTVAFGVAPIETAYPRPTWAEQDPAQWWSAARTAVRRGAGEGGRGARAGGGDRARLHGLHGRRLRPGRADRSAPPCSGWTSDRSARPTTSARPATRCSATSRAGSRPSGCCPRPSGSSDTSPRPIARPGGSSSAPTG